ncbi:anion exchange protein-like protein [Dinothrombium tinctorium]|uniref:Anion exchange protein-like protein n=1 Tax=Dinothrombium tinctorium TaxID=1965070 RepID=A0A3S3Q6G0_9ACAR|nr:anion exchange protein-like protein [Dinothrombium tinctorium]RWS14838.1 anion exchange protein-like protein [Dinothrombium tinctorium]
MSAALEGFCVTTVTKSVPFKDFLKESKCLLEILRFNERGLVILRLKCANLEQALNHMLKKSKFFFNDSEIIKSMFVDDKKILLHEMFYGLNLNPIPHDQSWLCLTCPLSTIAEREIMIACLSDPIHISPSANKIHFLILILTPTNAKLSKNEKEIAAIYSTLFANSSFRQSLKEAENEELFKQLLMRRAQSLIEFEESKAEKLEKPKISLKFCDGLKSDFKRRLKFYKSDFIDGFVGEKTIRKTIAATCFLYFAIILPCIAFGVRAGNETRGAFDSRKALFGQTIGGLFFGLFSGQPLVIIMTTAPLCLYTKVIFDISFENDWDFRATYTCVALWTALLLILYSIFDFSKVMHFCTKSTEEIFAVFSFFAFAVDAIKDVVLSFKTHFNSLACKHNVDFNITSFNSTKENMSHCMRETSLLYLLLVLGTVALAIYLYSLNQTPFFVGFIRETISDYALPISVLVFSFIASFVFREIEVDRFDFSESFELKRAKVEHLPLAAIFSAMILAFPLSLLFFMDQNISAAMVNNRANKLKKGPAYHLDLFVIAVLNIIISMFGFPLMHGMLPHSPLHARCLADIEARVENGHKYELVTKARETRVAVILAHVFIGLTACFLIPYPLSYIPVPVLDGLFIYCAVASLRGNEIIERVYLFITEQSNYPATHYIRTCKQRNVHYFTAAQLLQTALLCFSAFSPWAYFRMAYPLIIAILVPIRHYLLPLIIERKDLDNLDTTTGDY